MHESYFNSLQKYFLFYRYFWTCTHSDSRDPIPCDDILQVHPSGKGQRYLVSHSCWKVLCHEIKNENEVYTFVKSIPFFFYTLHLHHHHLKFIFICTLFLYMYSLHLSSYCVFDFLKICHNFGV